MQNIKSKVTKGHFWLLGIVLLNFVTELITGYSLNQNLLFVLKVMLYLSGIGLFFSTLKRFELKTAYFSFYTISAVLAGLFFLLGGIFLAIITSILLYPIYPKELEYETNSIKIYGRYQGFMSRCCPYEVVAPKLFVFEKHLGYITISNSIDPDKDEFVFKDKKITYKHELISYDFDKQATKVRDTTEILKFE
jgi:hypothetical protein